MFFVISMVSVILVVFKFRLVANGNHVFRFRLGTIRVIITQSYIITGCKHRVFTHTEIKFRFNYWLQTGIMYSDSGSIPGVPY